MRITKITVKDFRGFPGEYEFDLGEPGKNLLVYGENGSGKSSLFHAIDSFFESSQRPVDLGAMECIFASPSDPAVRLELYGTDLDGNRLPTSGTYEWSHTSSPAGKQLVTDAAKTRGCLDFRALLETHFVHRNEDEVEVFDLLLRSIIRHSESPIYATTFETHWNDIQKDAAIVEPDEQHLVELSLLIQEFNDGLAIVLESLTAKANELLGSFEYGTSLSLRIQSPATHSTGDLVALPPTVYLDVDYAGRRINAHHKFLNEARLSAIALVIYLASLLVTPRSELRALVLDDILIGIDMANRLPMLRILREHFSDWQILILTYDRVWFEIVRFQTEDVGNWCYYELITGADPVAGYDRPTHRSTKDGWRELLDRSKLHLSNLDDRAAAVYARAAFEYWARKYCDKKSVPVPFQIEPERPQINKLWGAIKSSLHPQQLLANQSRISDLERVRRVVLNPLSHSVGSPVVRTEVEDAIRAVEALQEMV